MKTIDARLEFEKALKEIARDITYYDYKNDPEKPGFDIQIKIKPKAVDICDKKNCNAGRGCIHRIVKRNIAFCVD